MAKVAYRVKNWSQYNQDLKRRGDVTVWIDDAVANSWYCQGPKAKIGAPFVYSDAAITCGLTIGAVFGLPLRQTEGFLTSILQLMRISLKAPCYSTFSRRAAKLEVVLPRTGTSTHIVLDSTGLKVYGEGEWKVRQYGYDKRRTWRKLHLAMDADTHQIISCCLTTNDFHDSQILPELLAGEENVDAVSGDGSYDTKSCYEAIEALGAKAIIPPRRGAKIEKHGNVNAPPKPRDENIRGIRKLGRSGWKKMSGYHTRSLIETAMGRVKTIFGGHLSARNFDQQATESFIKVRALNIMTMIGMPISAPIMR